MTPLVFPVLNFEWSEVYQPSFDNAQKQRLMPPVSPFYKTTLVRGEVGKSDNRGLSDEVLRSQMRSVLHGYRPFKAISVGIKKAAL